MPAGFRELWWWRDREFLPTTFCTFPILHIHVLDLHFLAAVLAFSARHRYQERRHGEGARGGLSLALAVATLLCCFALHELLNVKCTVAGGVGSDQGDAAMAAPAATLSDAFGEITSVHGPADPEGQATVNDFLDYTEYLPSDLVRSLTLMRKLDAAYLDGAEALHALTRTYGRLPSLPAGARPEPQQLRAQISRRLDLALGAREAAHAEAARLYDVVDRHFKRLSSIISKLRSLPQPPSRDPSPAARATASPPGQR
ncbi:MAG: hypothetical protein M1832_001361, partial [Thelocarpon impressellum]